jgi:hypothetical protein
VQGLVPPSTVTALNVAMPAEAAALTVPVKVHEEVITIVSVNPVVAVAPAPFSTVT